MSLVIALCGSKEAVIGADRRSISFLGECSSLEEELYSGSIVDDSELLKRATDLGAVIQIRDGREKVWSCGDVLVGEVTEISKSLVRRRRIYIAPGASLQVEVSGDVARISDRGGVGCTVFGNRFTQKLTAEEIGRAGGRVDRDLIEAILVRAGERSASVSREHTVLFSRVRPSDAKGLLLAAFEEDCQKAGWRICARQ